MTVVEIFSKKGCHLCEIARDTILRVQRTHPFELRQTELVEGHPLEGQYGIKVPVIVINGKFAFQYKVSERELIAKLRAQEE